jgi:hypothetical protein
VDLNKLTTADKVVVGGAIALLIASFLPWFGLDFDTGFGEGASVSGNGWDVGFLWGGIPVILGLLMVAQIAISRFSPDTTLPELPWSKVHLALGGLAAFLVVLKLLIGYEELGVTLDRKWGLFVAAVAAVVLGVGGFLKFQEGEDAGAAPAGPPQTF